MSKPEKPLGKNPRRTKSQPKKPKPAVEPTPEQHEQQTYAVAAMIARALGDPATLRIVELVAQQKSTPLEMDETLKLGCGLIDNRLFKLRRCGLVQSFGVPPKSRNLLRSDAVSLIVRELLNFSAWVKPFLPSTENDQKLRDVLGAEIKKG